MDSSSAREAVEAGRVVADAHASSFPVPGYFRLDRFVVCHQFCRVLGRHLEDDVMQQRQEGGVIEWCGCRHQRIRRLSAVFPAADRRTGGGD
jgi:hypothetical protein